MPFLNSIARLVKDPPPSHLFELSEAGVAMARTARDPEFDFRPLDAGIISVSPSRDNILEPEKLAATVRGMVPKNGNRTPVWVIANPRTASIPEYRVTNPSPSMAMIAAMLKRMR